MKNSAVALVAGILIGAALPVGSIANVNKHIPLEKINSDGNLTEEEELQRSIDDYNKVSIRKIVNKPMEYQGERVIVTGYSNANANFIENNGYSLDMDCGKYPDFEYWSPSGIKVYGAISAAGRNDPLLTCTKPPKVQN